MGKGMSNMKGDLGISWTFAFIILIIFALLVFHIVFTLRKQQNQLKQLIEQHNRLVHSLPMSLGMISTVIICSIIGAIMDAYMSASYIVGLIIGILVSWVICLPFKDGIAILDGVVSGAMGGLMGVMMAYMIPKIGLYTVVVLLTILFATTWGVMRRRIIAISSRQSLKQVGNPLEETEFF
jgi:MFS family permease